MAGVRKGLSGERSGLFHEAIRIIKEMRDATNGQYPRLAIWENVPGALTSNKGADFGVVLDEMAKSGCVALDWAILDAQYYGIAQRRRRIFVCATYDIGAAERSPLPLLPVQEGMRRHSQKGRQEKQKAAGKTSSSIGSSSKQGVLAFENSGFAKWQETDKALTLRARDAKGPGTIVTNMDSNDEVYSFDTQFGSNANVFTDHAPTLKATQQSPSVAYENDDSPIVFHPHRQDGVRLQGDTINTLTAFMGTGGLNTPMVAQAEQLNDGIAMTLRSGGDGGVPSSRGENLVIDAIAYDEYNDKLVEGGIHHAIRAGTKQSTGVLQNMVVRRLLPKECEILMGWPVDHTRWRADGKEQPDTARYKQTGNGVAAPVAEWLGKIFKGLLDDSANK